MLFRKKFARCILLGLTLLLSIDLHFSCTLPPIHRPAGPPCVLLVYSMVHHRRPSMTRCLPAGSDLTRDFLKEQIAQDVDMTEELDAASVVLIVIHILVTAIGLACYCTRSVCATPAATPQKTLLATPQTEYLNSANANASASPDANG